MLQSFNFALYNSTIEFPVFRSCFTLLAIDNFTKEVSLINISQHQIPTFSFLTYLFLVSLIYLPHILLAFLHFH